VQAPLDFARGSGRAFRALGNLAANLDSQGAGLNPPGDVASQTRVGRPIEAAQSVCIWTFMGEAPLPVGKDPDSSAPSRRQFLTQLATLSAGLGVSLPLISRAKADEPAMPSNPQGPGESSHQVDVQFDVNGRPVRLCLDPRVTLLDTLRDRLDLTGTKKGCDQGTCGACTVHVNGQRVLSCLTLAAMVNKQTVTTVEGLARGNDLHPVQAAFIACDGFQCGFCTPGQIMSAVACIQEGHTGSDDEIREFMSGNLCRCGAYPNIVDAVKAAAMEMKKGA
jgi:xanthine dehydrogenase YagT iron-sulfur-binding subunit